MPDLSSFHYDQIKKLLYVTDNSRVAVYLRTEKHINVTTQDVAYVRAQEAGKGFHRSHAAGVRS